MSKAKLKYHVVCKDKCGLCKYFEEEINTWPLLELSCRYVINCNCFIEHSYSHNDLNKLLSNVPNIEELEELQPAYIQNLQNYCEANGLLNLKKDINDCLAAWFYFTFLIRLRNMSKKS